MSGSSSLGTMTVGVSANVDPATKAVDALIGRMDRLFEVVSKAGKGSGGLQEWERTFDRQRKAVDDMAKVYTDFKGIPTAPGGAADTESTTRSMEQLGTQANRTRYAVLNLGYGVQDAVTVFGTSGFAGALRASANNLSGLGVIMANTQGGLAGLKAALMGPEFAILGIATALMLAADAFASYSKQQQKILDDDAEKRLGRFRPQEEIANAGRRKQLQQEMDNLKRLGPAMDALNQKQQESGVAQEKYNASLQQDAAFSDRLAKMNKQKQALDDLAQAEQKASRRKDRPISSFMQGDTDEERRANFLFAMRVQGQGLTSAQLGADIKLVQSQRDENAKQVESLRKEAASADEARMATEKKVNELQKGAADMGLRDRLEEVQQKKKALADEEQRLRQTNESIAKEMQNNAKMDALIAENRRKNAAWRAAGGPRGEEKMAWLKEDPSRAPTREEKDAIKRMQEKYPGLSRGELEGKMEEERKANEERIAAIQKQRTALDGLVGVLQKGIDLMKGTPAEYRDFQEQESNLEYRLSFLAKRRRELTAQSRAGMANVGVAAFESSAAYEALAKSRMQPAGDTDVLQRIAKAQETATKELAAIREKLDPGRGARIAILEKIE